MPAKVRDKSSPKRTLVPEAWFRDEVAYFQKLLGLDAWEITVEVRKGYQYEGHTDPHDGHLTCTMTFRHDTLKGEARFNVAHEMLHLATRQWDLADEKVLHDHVADVSREQALDIITKGTEDSIEYIAHALVRLTPERTEPV